jgi:hypothetical protein
MSDFNIPHTSNVWVDNSEAPRKILHVIAAIPQYAASEYAPERHDLRIAVANTVGDRTEYQESVIHWTDD